MIISSGECHVFGKDLAILLFFHLIKSVNILLFKKAVLFYVSICLEGELYQSESSLYLWIFDSPIRVGAHLVRNGLWGSFLCSVTRGSGRTRLERLCVLSTFEPGKYLSL